MTFGTDAENPLPGETINIFLTAAFDKKLNSVIVDYEFTFNNGANTKEGILFETTDKDEIGTNYSKELEYTIPTEIDGIAIDQDDYVSFSAEVKRQKNMGTSAYETKFFTIFIGS